MDGEDVLLAGVVGGSGERDRGGAVGWGFRDSVYGYNLKISLSELALEYSVGCGRVSGIEAVEVEVGVTVAPTGP